jgi:hypothetical protein
MMDEHYHERKPGLFSAWTEAAAFGLIGVGIWVALAAAVWLLWSTAEMMIRLLDAAFR